MKKKAKTFNVDIKSRGPIMPSHQYTEEELDKISEKPKKKRTGGHIFEVYHNGSEESFMTGATTKIIMDGRPVSYCTYFKFEVTKRGVAEVTMTLLGRVKLGTSVIGQYHGITSEQEKDANGKK